MTGISLCGEEVTLWITLVTASLCALLGLLSFVDKALSKLKESCWRGFQHQGKALMRKNYFPSGKRDGLQIQQTYY